MKSKKGLIIGIISVVVVALAVVLAIVFWPKGADKKETYTNAIKNSLNFRRVTDNFDVSKGTEDLEKLLEEHIIKVVFEGSTDGPESENGTLEAYLEKELIKVLGYLEKAISAQTKEMSQIGRRLDTLNDNITRLNDKIGTYIQLQQH